MVRKCVCACKDEFSKCKVLLNIEDEEINEGARSDISDRSAGMESGQNNCLRHVVEIGWPLFTQM